MGDGDVLPDMSEEVVRHVFGVDVLDPDVHVETCLNVVSWNVRLFEIVGCAAHAVGD